MAIDRGGIAHGSLVGAVVPVPLVWAIGTLLNGFMAFPNLIGLIMLGGVVARLTKEYFGETPSTA